MDNVSTVSTNGKPAAVVAFENWTTGEHVLYPDEPDFYQPTEQEEREGGEIMAAMHLDSYLPRHPSFKCFLAEQARLAKIRDNDKNWEWLGNLLTEHAARAMFAKARTPEQYEARCEVMSGASEALQAIAWIRRVAGMLESPFRALVPELERSAATLEQFVKAAS